MKPKRIMLGALLIGMARLASAAGEFTQCPGVTFDGYTFSGCASLMTANADGSITVKSDGSQPTNDVGNQDNDDALVGILNNSKNPISSIQFTSSFNSTGAFAFDSSGAITNNVFCPVTYPGATGYEGPGVVFSNLATNSVSCDTGTINFNPPIPPGGSAYFYLERPVNPAASISITGTFASVPAITKVTDQAGGGNHFTAGMPFLITGSGFGTAADPPVITVGNQAVSLLQFISSSQIVAQLPQSQPLGNTTVTVTSDGAPSFPFTIGIVALAPGIVLGTSGNAFYDSADNPITSSYLAVPNEEIYLIAEGLGPTSPAAPASGNSVNPSPTTNPVQVMLGGTAIQPDYAGLFVGQPSGYYKVSFKVPSTQAAGTPAVTLAEHGLTSNAATLNIGPAVPAISSIVNGATFKASGAAPNAFVSVFGVNFGSQDTKSNIFPATSFNGDSLTVNGTAVPLYFVFGAEGQINFVLPATLPTSGNVEVQMTNAAGTSNTFELAISSADVGLFRIPDPSNAKRNNGAMLVANTQWRVMPASMATALGFPVCAPSTAVTTICGGPAKVGDSIQIYLTGLGEATPNGDPNGQPLATGTLAPASGNPLYKTVQMPTVTIGGASTKVDFSGITPGNAGLYQINVSVPSGVTAGNDVPLVVTMPNGSTDTVTLAIH